MRRLRVLVMLMLMSPGDGLNPGMTRRRVFLQGAWTSFAFCSSSANALEKENCQTKTNPLFSKRTCKRYGLQEEGSKLLGCKPSENCVSTSAILSPEKFAAPWSFATSGDIETAFNDLLNALPSVGLTAATIDTDRKYIRANAPTTISGGYPTEDVDDVEFLLDPKQELVFYRSVSREAVFFFPPQNLYSVPISDGGSNRARLESLRTKLGWDTLAALYSSEDDDPRDYLPSRSPLF